MDYRQSERLRALASRGYCLKYSEHSYFSFSPPLYPRMSPILETSGAEGLIEHEPSRTRYTEKGQPDGVILALEEWAQQREEVKD